MAWPPHGAVPTWVFPSMQFVFWSFATIELRPGLFNSYTVTMNGQPAVSVQRVAVLCTGQGVPEYSSAS